MASVDRPSSGELSGTVLPLATGGRSDVVLAMPNHPVQLTHDRASSNRPE